jgi:hypothetical protein
MIKIPRVFLETITLSGGFGGMVSKRAERRSKTDS